MASQLPKNSVWSAMNYNPPRGRCNHKASLMSPGCPCLRFMLHPVKAATSFECDGCNHHASFHSLENPAEDVVLKKWAEQEASKKANQQAIGGAGSKKRKLITQATANANVELGIAIDSVTLDDVLEPLDTQVRPTQKPTKGSSASRLKKAVDKRLASRSDNTGWSFDHDWDPNDNI